MHNTSNAFLESIFSKKHKVYGFRLKPLSLYHLTVLEKYCPNALGANVFPDELALASAICSDGKGNVKLSNWKGFLIPFFNHEKQLKAWADYLADWMTLPQMLNNGGETRNNPYPFPLMYAAKLIKETGYSFNHVFYEMNISQVFWLVSAMGYLDTGETQVLSDKEIQINEIIGEGLTDSE